MELIDVSAERSVESVLKGFATLERLLSARCFPLYDLRCSTTIAAVVILYGQQKTLYLGR
ncbi:MAG: hypothetical protein QOE77_3272 [Blastocatellia bacterium]|jgi:hypothetical protein|nr:hypothetical protein [Blastocatellia bacterium]